MRKPQLDADNPRLLADRYQLYEQVAAGAMASIWRGHDQVLGRDVAVKLLNPELAKDAQFAAGFRAEAVNAANLNHPSIVSIFDIGEHEGVPYLVMELVEGASLREALDDNGPLPPGKVVQIGARVATALAYAHRAGVLHCNLKPTNVLLTPGGGVKVTDFSIARPASAEDASRTAELLGGGHLAPEQLLGEEVDNRTDVYALGACLYEMLTGTTPWKAAAEGATRPGSGDPQGLPDPDATIPPPSSLRAETPPDLETLVVTALERDPDRRFQSAQALARALTGIAAQLQPNTAETTLPAPATPTGRQDVQWPPPDPSTGRPQDRNLGHGGRSARPRPPLRFRLASALLGVLLAVVLAAVAANVLLRPTRPEAEGAPTTSTAPPASAAVQASAAAVLDPGGDGENDDLLANLTDGDPATSWRTESYANERFGLLKPGIGVVVEAGDRAAIRQVTVTLAGGGGTAEIRGGDELSDNVEDWAPLTEPQQLQQETTFTLPAGTAHRYYLLWFSTLPPGDGGSFRAEVSEVELGS